MSIRNIKMVPSLLNKQNSFIDEGTGLTYRRIFGGICWPSMTPGAVVVISEDKDSNVPHGPVTHFQSNKRNFWVLHSYENASLSDILSRCQELQRMMKVQEFFGDTTNRAMMRIKLNSESKYSIRKAPFVDESNAIEIYLTLIREKASAANKVLNFGENKALTAKLSSLDGMPDNMMANSVSPSIIALGYALAALVNHPIEKPIVPSVPYRPLDPLVGI